MDFSNYFFNCKEANRNGWSLLGISGIFVDQDSFDKVNRQFFSGNYGLTVAQVCPKRGGGISALLFPINTR